MDPFDSEEYCFRYVAKLERDITGALHLHVILPDQIAEVRENDEFVTFTTRIELESGTEFMGDDVA